MATLANHPERFALNHELHGRSWKRSTSRSGSIRHIRHVVQRAAA
jgi:hypothetical protein